MLNKKVLLDSSVIINLYEFEYRCKNWKISNYFKEVLKFIEQGDFIVIPEVKMEVQGKTEIPENRESWNRYSNHRPKNIMKIFDSSAELFSQNFPELLVNICTGLIDETAAQWQKFKFNQGNKGKTGKNDEFNYVYIDNSMYEGLKNICNISHDSLCIFLAKLAATIDSIPGSTKVVDMRLAIYSLFQKYYISTYDGAIIKAFKNIKMKHLILYQHSLFDCLGFKNP